jgi:predicted O-linked N-acetylglucosamine transferase (SPINDLY family)
MTGNAESALKSAYGLHRAGQFAEAARLYGEIIRAEPRNGQALYLLGYLHYQRGEYGDAERLMGDALALNPNGIDVLYNRALALMKLRRAQEALALLDRLLALNPGIAEAWHARGMALTALARDEDAVSSYGKTLLIRSAPETLNNRANALFGLKRFAEAAADYEAILTTDSKFPYARGSMAFSRLQSCDWRGLDEQRERISSELRAGGRVVQPGAMLAISASPEDQLRAAGIWAANEVPPSPNPLWRGEKYHHGRIRVAYLSADFHSHATATLIAGVFEHHDRNRFELHALSFGPDDGSAMRRRLLGAFDRFHDVRNANDREAAELLRRLEIDIAVDLKGYTQDSRPGILANRPAPVQAQYLGFPGTMGTKYIDYVIADATVVPAEHGIHYSEKLVTLPGSYQCNDNMRETAVHTPMRAELGLPETGFVFCCFNSSYKIMLEIFAIWMRLLTAVEGSVLWLLEDNPVAAETLRREAEARGVAPSRLVFARRVTLGEHLARHRLADLFLDTLPYGAHTTASDALWAGLPVLTCLGESFAGRVAASLNTAVGLPELIAHSLQDYEALALRLGREPGALQALKAKLAKNRDTTSLFDTARFTRNLEAAYTAMWERAVRGEPPANLTIGETRSQR